MKSGSGSSSLNEGISRHHPFTQFLAPTQSKCKSNFWLHLAVHYADVRTDTHTHTWVGRRELAREWRVGMVLRRATSRPRWCRLLALSTSRRWNTPRDAAANWCQRLDLRVWPRQRLLANDLQANHNSTFYCAENATNINYIRFPTSKSQIRIKGNEKRFSCNSLISSAQLVPSMVLAHRLSTPLLVLAHLPLPQRSYASGHISPCL